MYADFYTGRAIDSDFTPRISLVDQTLCSVVAGKQYLFMAVFGTTMRGVSKPRCLRPGRLFGQRNSKPTGSVTLRPCRR